MTDEPIISSLTLDSGAKLLAILITIDARPQLWFFVEHNGARTKIGCESASVLVRLHQWSVPAE